MRSPFLASLALCAALLAGWSDALAFDCHRASEIVAAVGELADPTDRERRLREALALCPRDGGARVLLGDLYRDRGDLERARRAYERALAISPNADEARTRLAALDAAGRVAGPERVRDGGPPAIVGQILGDRPVRETAEVAATASAAAPEPAARPKRATKALPADEIEIIRPTFEDEAFAERTVPAGEETYVARGAAPEGGTAEVSEAYGVQILRVFGSAEPAVSQGEVEGEIPASKVVEVAAAEPAAPRRATVAPKRPRVGTEAKAKTEPEPPARAAPQSPPLPVTEVDTPLACARADDLYQEGHALSDGSLGEEFAYQKAIALCPSHVASHNGLGVIYAGRGEWTAARERFERAVSLQPDFSKAWFNLSALYDEAGERERAIDALERTLRHDPDYAKAYGKLARLYVEAERLDDAVELYRRMVGRNEADAEAHFELGVLLWKRGDKEGGGGHLQRAVTLDPALMERPEARLIVKYSF